MSLPDQNGPRSTTTPTRKILIAVDGSVYSSNALRYVAQLFEKTKTIEFHLLTIISHQITATERAWLNEAEIKSGLGPTGCRQYEAAETCMLKAVDLLARHGVEKSRVTTMIRLNRLGIADDILHEARQGFYDALLIGRRGLGMIHELVLGSVSKTILQKCHDLPIWVIEGQVESKKILVPVDGSVHALRAVDHLGFILQDTPEVEITLFNSPAMFADQAPSDPSHFYQLMERAWCDEHLNRSDSLFHAPEQLLIEHGIAPGRIQRLHTTQGIYPSRQIVRQAMIDDFGTIVMGRRPAEAKKGLLRGVSDQVLLMADQAAIWIIG